MNLHPTTLLWITASAVAGVYLLCLPLHYILVKSNIVDRPNERSSHVKPTARGGGIAIILALLGTNVWIGFSSISVTLLGAAVGIAIISFVDDLRSLPPLIRFGCHGLAAIAMIVILGGLQLPGLQMANLGGLILLLIWMTGYTNAFNFMDGINGLAASQAVITGLGMGLLAGIASGQWSSQPVVICFILAGTALGFLPHNFPKARLFMGDVGSAPLGFLLAALVVWLARDLGWSLLAPLGLLHANFILDTGITLVRRMLRGDRWYEPHREHFYQRLIRTGCTHRFVTGCEVGLQLIVLGILLLYLQVGQVAKCFLAISIVAIWSFFYLWVERGFRRSMAQ